jgi:chemotaxis protein methyltransferase CheR
LFDRLAAALVPDGALCLGTSETVLGYTRALMPDPENRGYFRHAARTTAAGPARRYLVG